VDTHQATAFESPPVPLRGDAIGKRPGKGRLAIRFLLMALALAIVFGGLYGFAKFREKAIATYFATNRPPPTPVAAAEATLQSVPKSLGGIGTVWAVHQVTVAPEVGGRIVQIFFEPGAAVRAGDPLVQLNDKPEQGDLANYQAQAKLATLNLERSKKLVGQQFTPQATVDQNQALLEQANAGISKTQAVIAQKLIRAPFSGVLGIRQAELGQYVNPGGAIVTLTNLDALYVNFTLPEQNSSQVAVGQTVRLAVDAYPGRAFAAKVTTIEPQVSADLRLVKLQASLDNPDHALRPGMFARVEVALPPEPAMVTVPETAIDYTVYGDSAFVIREDGKDGAGNPVLKVTRTAVKTGDRFDNRVAIVSGLQAGDRVVASGQLKLSNGAAVTIMQSDALAKPSEPPKN
jgi:multidrug efflux system membrane fusion protein